MSSVSGFADRGRSLKTIVDNEGYLADNFAMAKAGSWTGLNILRTRSHTSGWAGTAAGARGAAVYTRDGTTGTPSTGTEAKFYDANGVGWVIQSDNGLNAFQFGAKDDATDQSSKIQLAVDALGTTGGDVYIPKGVKFSMKSITLPKRCNLYYYIDSDTSAGAIIGGLGTNEYCMFCANANDDGIVNEYRITSTFHTGLILCVRKDVASHDAHLGPGQSRTNPARASYNIHDEDLDSWRVVYEYYDTFSNFSAVSMHSWRRSITLNGIGTAAWSSVPPENTIVTGTTSGAKGFVLSVSAGGTLLMWLTGKFVAGETVSDNNETTVATISSVTLTLEQHQPIMQDFKRGNFGVGIPPGATRSLWTVGGKICATKSRAWSGKYIDLNVTNPGYQFIEDWEAGTVVGFEFIYDCSVAAGVRRIYKRKYNENTNRGLVGSLLAKCSFSNTALIEQSAYNIASIVRTAVGKYTVTIADDAVTADYSICIGNSDIADNSRWKFKMAGTFEIWNYNAAGALADLTSEVSVTCHCGDI